jgi:hypothetical protein
MNYLMQGQPLMQLSASFYFGATQSTTSTKEKKKKTKKHKSAGSTSSSKSASPLTVESLQQRMSNQAKENTAAARLMYDKADENREKLSKKG